MLLFSIYCHIKEEIFNLSNIGYTETYDIAMFVVFEER